MDIIEIQKQLQNEMRQLDKALSQIKERAEHKSHTCAIYEKEMAKAIIGLKNGKNYKLEDEIIVNPPATLIEKIAKGICWREKLSMDEAEASYKNCILGLNATQTKITAYQSINKYLDKV